MSAGEQFREVFGEEPALVWVAPGRVNLIGEHTDYNEGFVLPLAVNRRASVAVRSRPDRVIRCWSRQRGGEPVSAHLDQLAPGQVRDWTAYPLGVAWALQERGLVIGGFDLVLDSDVPIGAGLSSSAAVEVATASALVDLHDLPMDRLQVALACHHAETSFVGAPVGVMDQVVSACATEGSALLIDCRSLELTAVPFDPAAMGCELLVIDTGAAHANVDGAYAERRAACLSAASDLGLPALRDADAARVAAHPRARHVVAECTRVLAAVEALKASDAERLGALLLASHVSLRDDFEVSCPELNTAVDAAMGAGALGARLTGAGFGGSAIALVPTGATRQVEDAVRESFAAQAFSPPEIFAVTAGPGAHRQPLPVLTSEGSP